MSSKPAKPVSGDRDPAERAIVAGLFTGITEEMGVVLRRTAYSPNIKERRDYSCALFDAQGSMVAQAAHIPVHLGAMPMSVAAALKQFPTLRQGDVVILNDPYAGGTHLPDITLVSPFVHRGKRLALLATRAHHADVGGITPGSLPIATDISQEGVRIPPTLLYRRGQPQQAVFHQLMSQVRTPDERAGDLRAQAAAHQLGARRLTELLSRYAPARARKHMKDMLAHGRAVMRSVLRAVPDGTYSFEDALEDDGISRKPIRIRVSITVQGDRATVDFTGSGPACRGSLNAVRAITISAAYYCFLCLVATPSRLNDGHVANVPLNAGSFSCIRVITPRHSIVNASHPRAVAGGNVETSQRIVDVVFGALAKALPDIIPAASQGTMNNLTLGAESPSPFAYYETIAGGMGARPDRPGIDGIQVHMTNTLNTPAEALEFAYPLRIERYELAQRSGGQGKYRGGHGIRRDLRVLAPCTGTILSERRKKKPYGLSGGQHGQQGENSLVRDGKKQKLRSKVHLELQEGDVISIRTPGGGGFGRKK